MPDTDATPVLSPKAQVALTWGLPVPLVAAGAMSFTAQIRLALAIGVPEWLAWLLPVGVEVYATVALIVWFGTSRKVPEARKRARHTAFRAIALSFLLNGAWTLVHARVFPVCWELDLAVGIVPPYIVMSLMHLMVDEAPQPEPVKPRPRPRPVPAPTPVMEGVVVKNVAEPDLSLIDTGSDSPKRLSMDQRTDMVRQYLNDHPEITEDTVTSRMLADAFGNTDRQWRNVLARMRDNESNLEEIA